jgi:hypothetical protein
MLNQKKGEIETGTTTYELCLACTRDCRRSGPPWCKLECPLFSGTDFKYENDQIVSMTDEELVARIAYG